jgi:hypothetical protein
MMEPVRRSIIDGRKAWVTVMTWTKLISCWSTQFWGSSSTNPLGRAQPVTDVVDQDVGLAVPLQDRSGQGAHGRPIADVHDHRLGVAALFGDGRHRGLGQPLVDLGDDHAGPVGGQQRRRGGSDPPAPAGDDGDPVGQQRARLVAHLARWRRSASTSPPLAGRIPPESEPMRAVLARHVGSAPARSNIRYRGFAVRARSGRAATSRGRRHT